MGAVDTEKLPALEGVVKGTKVIPATTETTIIPPTRPEIRNPVLYLLNFEAPCPLLFDSELVFQFTPLVFLLCGTSISVHFQ